jgi:hypothetical protein
MELPPALEYPTKAEHHHAGDHRAVRFLASRLLERTRPAEWGLRQKFVTVAMTDHWFRHATYRWIAPPRFCVWARTAPLQTL